MLLPADVNYTCNIVVTSAMTSRGTSRKGWPKFSFLDNKHWTFKTILSAHINWPINMLLPWKIIENTTTNLIQVIIKTYEKHVNSILCYTLHVLFKINMTLHIVGSPIIQHHENIIQLIVVMWEVDPPNTIEKTSSLVHTPRRSQRHQVNNISYFLS